MLITGALGFIGLNLLKQTQAVPFDLKSGDDINSLGSLKALYRSGPIVHLAAESGVPQSIEDPDPSFITNTLGTYNVLKFAKEKNCRIVLASSAAADNMTSPYAASKSAGEAYAQAFYKAYGLSYAALRFSNVYGPLSDKKTSCIHQMIKSAVYNNEIVVHGDGGQLRDFIFVDDVCSQILEFAYSDDVGIFDICTGKLTSVLEVAEIIKDLTGAEIVFAPARAGDVSKPAPTLPYSKHFTKLEEGIKRTLEYFK